MGSSALHFNSPTTHSTLNLNSVLWTSRGILRLNPAENEQGHTRKKKNRYVQPLDSSGSHRLKLFSRERFNDSDS